MPVTSHDDGAVASQDAQFISQFANFLTPSFSARVFRWNEGTLLVVFPNRNRPTDVKNAFVGY